MSEKESLLSQVHDLMAQYAPGIRLKSVLRNIRSASGLYTPKEKEIEWYIGNGLTVLLHEIGHAHLRHNNTGLPWRARLIEEVEAWLWAEKTARKEKILFDYPQADECFEVYFINAKRRQLVFINWQWKPKEKK